MALDPEITPERHNAFKVYEHIQNFNTADLDETMDVDEKFKRRAHHERIMQKLDARPDNFKTAQFLKYEKINEKSHLFNQVQKTDRMYRELNAATIKQYTDSQKSGNEHQKILKMYKPYIES